MTPLIHLAASRGDTRQLVHVVQEDPAMLEQLSSDGTNSSNSCWSVLSSFFLSFIYIYKKKLGVLALYIYNNFHLCLSAYFCLMYKVRWLFISSTHVLVHKECLVRM